MKPIPLIRASGPLTFVGLLSEAGAPVDRLWEWAGLPLGALREPNRLVPLHSMIRFTERAADELGLPDLGLRVAEREQLEAVGAFGVAIRSAPTLQKGVEAAQDLVAMHDSGERYWMVLEGDSARLCRRIRDQGDHFAQADLMTVGFMVELVRLAAGPEWSPSRVELQSIGAQKLEQCEIFSDAAVKTGQAVTSITFPRRFLARRLAPRSPRADSARALPDDGWRASRPPSDYLDSIRVAIATLLEAGQADITAAARAGGTSVRSFQRRLAEQGASYSNLVEEIRLAAAMRYLEDPDIKIIDVALGLGYSDPAHFTRAFRRWMSVSPAAFRRELLSSPLRAGARAS